MKCKCAHPEPVTRHGAMGRATHWCARCRRDIAETGFVLKFPDYSVRAVPHMDDPYVEATVHLPEALLALLPPDQRYRQGRRPGASIAISPQELVALVTGMVTVLDESLRRLQRDATSGDPIALSFDRGIYAAVHCLHLTAAQWGVASPSVKKE